jgi:hypothetical protein
VRQTAGADSPILGEARTAAERRYAAHWRTDQGFSVDTLRAREAWFTPALYQLLLADMSGDGVGVLDYDPFSDAQDNAQRFALGTPHASHDTVYVPVDVRFDSPREAHRSVTLAMVRAGSGWQIGDFIDQTGSLVAQLRKHPPAASRPSSATKDGATH